MHLALETDYAVRMVSVLCDKHRDGITSLGAAVLCTEACVHKPTALKVLRSLKDKGILHSVLGAGGGYSLAKAPESISLLDVIEAMEGKIQLSRCLSPEYDCSKTGKEHCECNFHRFYKEVNDRLCAELSAFRFGK